MVATTTVEAPTQGRLAPREWRFARESRASHVSSSGSVGSKTSSLGEWPASTMHGSARASRGSVDSVQSTDSTSALMVHGSERGASPTMMTRCMFPYRLSNAMGRLSLILVLLLLLVLIFAWPPSAPPPPSISPPPPPIPQISHGSAPVMLRPCAVRSIASGFFAHVSLVVDGFIRCDDLSRSAKATGGPSGVGDAPTVRIVAGKKNTNFYLTRPGDEMWHNYFLPTSAASLLTPNGLATIGTPLPKQSDKSLRRMWMSGKRQSSIILQRDGYGPAYFTTDRFDEEWHIRFRVRAHHYLHERYYEARAAFEASEGARYSWPTASTGAWSSRPRRAYA